MWAGGRARDPLIKRDIFTIHKVRALIKASFVPLGGHLKEEGEGKRLMEMRQKHKKADRAVVRPSNAAMESFGTDGNA